MERHGIRSIAIPALGCGHGGLTWEEVGPMIRTALEPLAATVEIRLYPPTPSGRQNIRLQDHDQGQFVRRHAAAD
ncbi:hypothetical protein [Nocardia asteroides]|uniref:hypothetical protein n=1 Tax=Nocardia asteroides TaxID=1824 RepID=UPI0033E4F33E